MRFSLDDVERRRDIDFKRRLKNKKKNDRDERLLEQSRQSKKDFYKYIDISYEYGVDEK